MNQYLSHFVQSKFSVPGKALDLGAGDFSDVKALEHRGWICDGIDFNTGVDLEFPFESEHGPYDLVFSNYVMHKIRNKHHFLQTISKNLKPGGWAFIHTFDASDESGPSSGITESSIRRMLGENGFGDVQTKLIRFFDDEEGHHHWHVILEAFCRKLSTNIGK
jgi:SAM-dependent methyltransferase